MRATPRPQAIGFIVLAFAAIGALLLVWGSGSNGVPIDPPRPLELAVEGLRPVSGEKPFDIAAVAGPEGAVEGSSGLALRGSGRAALAPEPMAVGRGLVEVRATLLVSDGSNGLAIEGATVTEAFWQGQPLDPREGWRGTSSDSRGLIELVCRVPVATALNPEVAHEFDATLDVRVAASGYIGAAATDVDALLESEIRASPAGRAAQDDGPVHEILLYPASSLVLDVLGAPSGAEGVLALWFERSAKAKNPDLELSWPPGQAEAKDRGVSLALSAGGAVRLVFRDLSPGPLSVALALEGFPVALQQALTLQSGEQLEQSLQVEEGEVANGIVRDLASKTPIAGITVIVSPLLEGLNQRIDRLPYPPQVTDERGAFSIPGLPLGELAVELHTADGVKHPRKLVILKGNMARRHELNVRGSASLSGRVELSGGLSSAGLRVLVTTGEDAAGVRARENGFFIAKKFGRGVLAQVDPRTGKFAAEAVPSGRRLVIHAMADGSTYTSAKLPALGLGESKEDIQLSLEPRPRVHFRVETTTGEPVTAARVSFKGSIAEGLPNAQTRTVSRWSHAVQLEVRSDGLFAAAPRMASPEKIRIRWEGRTHEDLDWPEDGLDAVPTFTIAAEPLMLVEVHGSDGVAVPGARVRAEFSKPGATSAKRGKGPSSVAVTDDFGRAQLRLPLAKDGTDPGPLDLRVTARGYSASVGLQVDKRDALPRPAKLVVLERAELLEPAVITGRLVRGNGEALPAPRFDGLRGGAAHVKEHSFELRGIRPGRVRVAVHCDRFESLSLPTLRLRPGEHYDVGEVVMRHATAFSVTVKDSKGRPAKNAQVELLRLPVAKGGRKGLPAKFRFPAKANARGTFTRRDVPRAKWRLVVKQRGHVTHQELVRLSRAKQELLVHLKATP